MTYLRHRTRFSCKGMKLSDNHLRQLDDWHLLKMLPEHRYTLLLTLQLRGITVTLCLITQTTHTAPHSSNPSDKQKERGFKLHLLDSQ